MLLIIALGNIGAKYERTRHNAGFLSADFILNEPKNKIEQICDFNNQKFKGALYKARLNGESALILKPATFMNLSGEAALAVCNFYKPDKIAVLHDDLDLPLGALRFKFGGGSGGHNGLKSLDSKIGSEYYRVRIGIGKPNKSHQAKNQNEGAVIEWVLSDFKKDELEIITPTLKAAAIAASELCFIENPQELNNKISNKFSRKGASFKAANSADSIESKNTDSIKSTEQNTTKAAL